ncbi:MAG: hypothetical protein WCQ54_06730 [Clostridiaceae bacterium]
MKSEKVNSEKMKSEKVNSENDEKIYTGKGDEEVLNCDGEPCNFVCRDTKIQK